jgi:uncharacterized protein (TIGR03000 family)
MRPRSNRSTVPAHGFVATLLLVLAAEPAWAQHVGHSGGSGGPGAGHHMGGGGVAGIQHHGGAASYGYGGGYLAGYGYGQGGAYPASYGYGSLYSPYATGYAPAVASLASSGGGYSMYPAVGPLLPGAVAQHAPLHFAGIAPPYDASALDTSPGKHRPADNAGHFELILPFEAEVFVNGARTSQTGFIRHYNTPKLTPGSTYHYQVRVRYMNAQRDMVEDTRDIAFKANDWYRIDFTRLPAPKTVANP